MKREAFINIKYRIAVSLVFLLLPLTAWAAPVGKISNLVGNVDITVTGKAARVATLGDSVNMGDFIRTKSKSKVEITFNEGHILKLAENTRVGITEYMSREKKSSSRFNLFRGRIQNIVKFIGVGSRYEVQTPTAVCGVRGTIFFVGQEDRKTDVAVLEGKVVVTSYLPAETPEKTPRSVMLKLDAGQGTNIDGHNPPQVMPISKQRFNEMRNKTDISGTSASADSGRNLGTAPPPPPHPATSSNMPALIVPPPVEPVQKQRY